jgi:hypothetical protein
MLEASLPEISSFDHDPNCENEKISSESACGIHPLGSQTRRSNVCGVRVHPCCEEGNSGVDFEPTGEQHFDCVAPAMNAAAGSQVCANSAVEDADPP